MIEIDNKQVKKALKLIKDAKKLGVISMKLGTLEFSFAESEETLAPRGAFNPTKKNKAAALASKEKAESQLEFDSAKDELGIMHVEDPAGFERAMVENDLQDASEGNLEETHNSSVE